MPWLEGSDRGQQACPSRTLRPGGEGRDECEGMRVTGHGAEGGKEGKAGV